MITCFLHKHPLFSQKLYGYYLSLYVKAISPEIVAINEKLKIISQEKTQEKSGQQEENGYFAKLSQLRTD